MITYFSITYSFDCTSFSITYSTIIIEEIQSLHIVRGYKTHKITLHSNGLLFPPLNSTL